MNDNTTNPDATEVPFKFQPGKRLELPPALHALQSKPTYEGTVPPDEVKRRRAKNKVARKSRRRNCG